MPLHPKSITDFSSLLEYLNTELDWDVDASDAKEYSFDYTAAELGLDPQYSVHLKDAKRIRTGDGVLPVFWLEFENKRLPVVVLRRILRAFVKKKRPSSNPSTREVFEHENELIFICALGEGDNRGLTLAHFRPLENDHLAQLRTFGWDGQETQFHHLEKHLRQLNWDNRENWSAAFIAEHGRAIKDSKELALALADFAREIRAYTLSLYEVEKPNGALHELHKNFGALLGSTSPEQFADAVAQTVTSSLLAVRFEGHTLENVALTEIGRKIPFTNPFLTEFIEHLARIGFHSELQTDFDDLGIEDLKAFLNAVNIPAIREKFGSTSQGGAQDPVIHFYETFLAAYDSNERMKRGVYYTPKPVVDFIVRGVDHLLREELGFELGLADASRDENGNYNVTILDPATGTGTFLVAVVESIYATMCGQWKKQGKRQAEYSALWDEYVSRDLLPRLFGFELMMAPYTVAHLKIGLKLAEFGYTPKPDERLNVFLTNTLEQSGQLALDLPGFLSKEASEAARVKNQTRVSVVVGNPPYSGHSANENKWIRDLLRTKLPDGADSIFKVDGADLGERNPKWLNDDYVKFTRYAQWRLAQNGRGVLGFITNHGYLDNPTFRGLRQSLMTTFPQMWQLDLHGNSKKKEKTPDGKPDENVFEIQQGVSLNFGVKTTANPERERRANESEKQPVAHALGSQVHRADLWGTQNEKYAWCENSKFQNANWQEIEARKPNYLFVPQDGEMSEEYECGVKVTKVFPVNVLGFQTHRDNFAVDFDKEVLEKRISDLRNPNITDENLRERYGLKDNRDWQLSDARNSVLKDKEWKLKFLRSVYRPFDNRFCYFSEVAMDYPRRELTDHVALKENISLLCSRQQANLGFRHCLVATHPANDCAVSTTSREANQVFPLYLYNPPLNWDTQLLGTGAGGRRANLAPGFVARLGTLLGLGWQSDGGCEPLKRHANEKLSAFADNAPVSTKVDSLAPACRFNGSLPTFGPEDILAYIYAIFHAPSYRRRYAEFLKIDFPRVPLTDDAALFWELAEVGRALMDCHLLNDADSGVASQAPTIAPVGEVGAGYPKYESGKVVINKAGAGFEDVPESVWNFHIGGYQVAHKWLKDRKGRELSDEDAAHYRRVLVALEQTISHMTRVDEIIASRGGWPLAGSQGGSTLGDAEIKSFFAARDAKEVDSRPAKPVGARHASPKTPQLPKHSTPPISTPPISTPPISTPPISTPPVKAQRKKGEACLAPTNVRAIGEYSRDELIAVLKKVMKRKWIGREDAIRESARVLGFARTGGQIQIAFRSAINGAIRRGVLEYDGDWIRRAKSEKS